MSRPEPVSTGSDAPSIPTGFSAFLDDVRTIPNAITLARLLLLPLFLWLLFVQEDRAAAAWLLGGISATDWVDGFVARRYHQVSEFGKVFDPTVDRLLFFVAVTAILIDGSMPVWFGIAVLVRELSVGLMMAIATVVYKIDRIDVTFLGKAATLLLMFAVPGFLMGNSDFPGAGGFEVVAWILGIPGLALSVWTAVRYVPQVRTGLASARERVSFPADR